MGTFSIWHIIILIAVLLLVFGRPGKISNLMGDVAKGVKAFKSGMKEEEAAEGPQPDVAPKRIVDTAATPAPQPERDPAQH